MGRTQNCEYFLCALHGLLTNEIKPVPESASFSDFRDISGKEGGELLVATLREMLSGKVIPALSYSCSDVNVRGQAVATPQKDSVNVRKAPMISFDDTLVDPTAQTAHEISRRHRALEVIHQNLIKADFDTRSETTGRPLSTGEGT